MIDINDSGSGNIRFAIAGLVLQIIATLFAAWWCFAAKQGSGIHLFITALAPCPVWISVIIQSYALRKNDRTAVIHERNKTARATGVLKYTHVVVPFLTAVLFIPSTVVTLDSTIFDNMLFRTPVPLASSIEPLLFSLSVFISTMISLFYIKLSDTPARRVLRSGAVYMVALTIMLSLYLLDTTVRYFDLPLPSHCFGYCAAVFNSLLGLEQFFILFTIIVKPQDNRAPRSAAYEHRSFIIDLIIRPHHTGETTSLLLGDILGINVSAAACARFISRTIIPFTLCSVLFLALVSSFVIIRQGEEALLLVFGKITRTVLTPGIHVKLPFPISGIRRFDTEIVRRIHVGSHKPHSSDGAVFKSGVPLLWTSEHGITTDELLIVASPRQMIRNAIESGGKLDIKHDKTPSVSLAGADVVVDYRISDLHSYASKCSDPDRMLSILAESEVSRSMLSFDIDTLLSDGRIALAGMLESNIRNVCTRFCPGIDILNVGISVIHPPTVIADAFEENVSALQERETRIQQAQQTSLRMQIETAGSIEAFSTLANRIGGEETRIPIDSAESAELLLRCGGDISRIMTDALAYRWSRENIERGKNEKFREELRLFTTAGEVYRYERYLSVLDSLFASRKKILLSRNLRDILIETGQESGMKFRSTVQGF